MAKISEPVRLTYGDATTANVVVGDVRYESWPDLLADVKGLDETENAALTARIMTHFSYRARYKVIEDPAAYEEMYRARLAEEEPGAPFRQDVVRSKDFGVPDFSAIHAPRIEDGRLTYFVYDTALFVPYGVSGNPADPDLTSQKYALLSLSPA